jgi:phage baseplate assembly protein W
MAEQIFFKDLPLAFNVNPITKDVSFAKNEDAVKKSLLNLLRTPLGTRPFRPDFGVNLSRYLFEPADYDTEVSINKEIADAILRFEPRVQLISIDSRLDSDVGIKVTVTYYVVGFPQQQTIETTITTRVK